MDAVTVHQVDERMTVSLTPLPGFRNMGCCVVRNEQGQRTGVIQVYFVGNYFHELKESGEFTKVENKIRTLARNRAVKMNLGTQVTRLTLSTNVRATLNKLTKVMEP